MERIYHRYELWECYKSGFFNKISGDKKVGLSKKVIELFTNPEETEIFMRRVISEWKYSCEHNLTNNSLNRVAWLGQSACCLYAKVPYNLTMETWREVPEKYQIIACDIAEKIIKEYESKNIQLCLKII